MGIIGGAVKLRSGLEGSVLSRQGGRPHLREQSGYSGLTQRPECARGFQRLIGKRQTNPSVPAMNLMMK